MDSTRRDFLRNAGGVVAAAHVVGLSPFAMNAVYAAEEEKKPAETAAKKSAAESRKKAEKKSRSGMEKTTLGDITDLAAIKEEMEEKQKKSSKK